MYVSALHKKWSSFQAKYQPLLRNDYIVLFVFVSSFSMLYDDNLMKFKRFVHISAVFFFVLAHSTSAQNSSELHQIFGEQDVLRYEDGASLYLDLLMQAATPPHTDELTIHLQLMGLIIPEADLVRSSLDALEQEVGTDSDVFTLIQWWNQQDPIPATLTNERLIEHLSRVYFALKHYNNSRSSLGIDDRGKILIRLGWPDTQTEVKLKNSGLYLRPIEYTLPRNEFWVYRRVHEDAHYLFVYQSRRRGYRLGAVEDLIPNKFRTRKEDAPVLLSWLDDIFQQLSIQHSHYGTLFDTISNYVSIASSDETQPYYFTKQILRDSRILDDFHHRSRNEQVPLSATEMDRSPVPLNPCVRWTRFLEPDGSTRLNIAWGLNPKSLKPSRRVIRRLRKNNVEPSDDFLVTSYLVSLDSSFAPTNLRLRQYHLTEGVDSSFPARSWVIRGVQDPLSLALQWEYAWTQLDTQEKLLPSVKLGFHVQRIHSIHPLNAAGSSPEMSDILLSNINEEGIPEKNSPVVTTHWDPNQPLGVYFEVYFLNFNDEDQTDYTVTYEIESTDGIMSPKTSASTTHSSPSSTVQEHIVLDLSKWQEAPVAITIRITDNVSGKILERSSILQLTKQNLTCEPVQAI